MRQKSLSPITVAIADDHLLFRRGLIELLGDFRQIKLLFDAANGQELLDMIADAPAMPDICILDINMPVMNGYDTAKAINQRYPGIKILALSMYNDESSIIRMLRNGARGYVLKDAEPTQLKEAIIAVARNGHYDNDIITDNILHEASKVSEDAAFTLTPREINFLKYCCTDYTYREIGDQMGLSSRTVEGYRDMLFEKLGVRSRTGLALYAVKTGIVTLFPQ